MTDVAAIAARIAALAVEGQSEHYGHHWCKPVTDASALYAADASCPDARRYQRIRDDIAAEYRAEGEHR